MTSKPITTRPCNEQSCISIVGNLTFAGINTAKIGPMTIWIAYATDESWSTYVKASPAFNVPANSTGNYQLSDLGLAADIPEAHRKRIFVVFKTAATQNVGFFQLKVATSTQWPATIRNVAIYSGFTGTCSNDSLDDIYVDSFAHTTTLYTGPSFHPNDSLYPKYRHLGNKWGGYYYNPNMTTYEAGISLPPSSNTIVTALGIDLYGVGF